MNIARWAQHQSRSIIFLVGVLALVGAGSISRLPVLLFPQVSFPRVRVALSAGDRPAERMLIEVTRPVEEAVRGIPGVRRLRSVTSRGSADADVDFNWGQDMISAELQVSAQLTRIAATLPMGTSFAVRRMDPTVFPVIAYSLTSDSRSLVDLRNLALYELL
ncbi:MAG: efflux RND transporter permease subunit, partial [Steroidobacteraceae bacterium]